MWIAREEEADGGFAELCHEVVMLMGAEKFSSGQSGDGIAHQGVRNQGFEPLFVEHQLSSVHPIAGIYL
jgi:hypothetical protein